MGDREMGIAFYIFTIMESTTVGAAACFNKGRAMCCHFYVITHVKDPQLSVVRVGHCVLLAGFCLSMYSLHVLNGDVNMIIYCKMSVALYCLYVHTGDLRLYAKPNKCSFHLHLHLYF